MIATRLSKSTSASCSPACIACGSTERSYANFTAEAVYPLYRCRRCGLGTLEITQEEGTEGFDEYWTEINRKIYAAPEVRAELCAKYESYFRIAAELVPNKHFLDVGSGAGMSIGAAAKLGFRALGIEPSAGAVELSRSMFDVPVICGLLQEGDDLPTNNGMLSLWDVIEHVSDPAALLKACHKHLAPRGVLLLETPDEGAPLRALIRAIGRAGVRKIDLRSSIYYRAHRFYFTRRSMTFLLERCGFTGIRYFEEHTMFRKELLKKRLYGRATWRKQFVLRLAFAALEQMPFMANKMVVMAVKGND